MPQALEGRPSVNDRSETSVALTGLGPTGLITRAIDERPARTAEKLRRRSYRDDRKPGFVSSHPPWRARSEMSERPAATCSLEPATPDDLYCIRYSVRGAAG